MTNFLFAGVVKKQRYLYIVGQTRVHVDHVDCLGDFMELEVLNLLSALGRISVHSSTIGEGKQIRGEERRVHSP
jgi:hypothetical protein